MVRTACAVALACLLMGCDDIPRAQSKSDIQQIAREEISSTERILTARIDQLERELAEQDKQLDITSDLARANSEAHESLRKTFNSNVDLNNSEKVRAMTRRGACGAELVTFPSGGTTWRNKECTLKDLR